MNAVNELPILERLANLERRLAAVEQQAPEITIRVVEGEQLDVTALAYRVAEIVRRHAAPTPQDEKVTEAIDLIKKIRRVAQQGGCSMSQAAWALIQRSVPADLTHAVQPFPETD